MTLRASAPSDRLFLLGHEHGAHASVTDLPEQLIWADPRAGTLSQSKGGRTRRRLDKSRVNIDHVLRRCGSDQRRRRAGCRLEKSGGPLMRSEQLLNLCEYRGIVGSDTCQESGAVGTDREFQGLAEETLHVGRVRLHWLSSSNSGFDVRGSIRFPTYQCVVQAEIRTRKSLTTPERPKAVRTARHERRSSLAGQCAARHPGPSRPHQSTGRRTAEALRDRRPGRRRTISE